MSDLIYLYGFVPAGAARPPSDLTGQAGRAVELLESGGIGAVMGRVPADAFSGPTLDERLRDLAWVAERGLEHERVVAWFVDHAHIVPVPLFTMYTGVDALRAAIAGRGAEIARQLDRFRGLREWDLKVAYDAATLDRHLGDLSDEIRRIDAELASAPPGRRYLLEKKRAAHAAAALAGVARREAIELLERLTAGAREVRSLPLPDTGRELPVVLHAALLLDGEAEPAATREVLARREALTPIGIAIDWSGPWAPYRFLAGTRG